MYSRFKNILFFIFDNNFLCDFVHRVKITFFNEYKVIQLLYPSCTVHFETIKLKFGETDYRITKIATEVGVTSIPMQLVNYIPILDVGKSTAPILHTLQYPSVHRKIHFFGKS